MKIQYFVLTAFLLMLMTASMTFAQVKSETPQQLATRVSKAFKAKRLATLDAGKPYNGRVKLVIEHSLSENRVSRSFSSLKLASVWLFRGRPEGGVNAGSLKGCSKGTCTFVINGLLHNSIYLKKVTYAFSNGRPVIKSVHILDGD